MTITNLGLLGYHSVQFAVHNIRACRRFFEHQLSMLPVFESTASYDAEHHSHSVVLKAGTGYVMLTEPLSDHSEAAIYLKKHKEGVMRVQFAVRDIQHTFNVLDERRATLVHEIKQTGAFRYCDITTPIGDVLYRYIEGPVLADRSKATAEQFFTGFAACASPAAPSPIHWLEIDHLTTNVHSLRPVIDWYQQVLGMEQFWQIQFHTTQLAAGKTKATGSGLKSIVMHDPASGIKFATNEAWRPFFGTSQIEHFVADNRGGGIQHIALSVPDIINTLDQLTQSGLQFLKAPPRYYENLSARFQQVGLDMSRIVEPIKELQARNILIDGSQEGYMLQIFTDEIGKIQQRLEGPPAFFEVIQRAGDRGFGYGNFRALFEAIEAIQSDRAAVLV